ncbi:MAG: D-aminoacylase [Firmicutes bacterium]|nr:D-aminoacylase [Bacillota bacterium]
MYDLLIKNGRIVDGSGAPWFRGDVAIKDGCIVQIGKASTCAEQEIDARDLYVTPGFIDIHTHSDESVLIGPESTSKITQGVTTEVVGNCGYSPAPAYGGAREGIQRSLAEFKLALTWESFGEYLALIRKAKPALNIYPLVGHGVLRSAAGGSLAKMKKLLREALACGARGMSTGLIYPPGCFAETREISELCRILAEHNAIYTSHIRDEGDRLLEAIQEAIQVGTQTGVRVEISHLKAAGPANHGKTEKALELIAQARESGVDVAFDAYPYTASATGLSALLPHWAHAGGRKKLAQRLADPEASAKLQKETEAIAASRGGWQAVLISWVSNQNYQELVGQTIAEAANKAKISPWELARELLQANPDGVEIICFSMSQADVDRVICHPWASYGSDATSRAPEGILASGRPHPRAYGTFPKILREYVRERRLLSLEEAVRKMTSAPAARLNLSRRGLLRPGMAADIVILDLERVGDTATYLDPHCFATGIEFVLVNGGIAYDAASGKIRTGHGRVLSFEGGSFLELICNLNGKG